MNRLRISWCPICRQGWVTVEKDVKTQSLFLYCNECETEWTEPAHVIENHSSIRDAFGMATEPTIQEVEERGWLSFILSD